VRVHGEKLKRKTVHIDGLVSGEAIFHRVKKSIKRLIIRAERLTRAHTRAHITIVIMLFLAVLGDRYSCNFNRLRRK